MTPEQDKKQRGILSEAHFDHEKSLNTYAFFKTSNHALGEDLVQDTFMKTWKYLQKGGKIDLMRAFLYHVLNGLIVDEYRKNKTVSLDVILSKGLEPKIDNSKNIFNILDGKTAILFIKLLPPKYEKVIRMKYIQDLSLEEMSLITGQSRKTVAVQIHRGMKKLKVIYSNQQ